MDQTSVEPSPVPGINDAPGARLKRWGVPLAAAVSVVGALSGVALVAPSLGKAPQLTTPAAAITPATSLASVSDDEARVAGLSCLQRDGATSGPVQAADWRVLLAVRLPQTAQELLGANDQLVPTPKRNADFVSFYKSTTQEIVTCVALQFSDTTWLAQNGTRGVTPLDGGQLTAAVVSYPAIRVGSDYSVAFGLYSSGSSVQVVGPDGRSGAVTARRGVYASLLPAVSRLSTPPAYTTRTTSSNLAQPKANVGVAAPEQAVAAPQATAAHPCWVDASGAVIPALNWDADKNTASRASQAATGSCGQALAWAATTEP